MDVFLEIFGYIGTALVIISMTMKDVVKLRIINMSGACINLIYAIICNTWPVAVLNLCLLVINMYHTLVFWHNRSKEKKANAQNVIDAA